MQNILHVDGVEGGNLSIPLNRSPLDVKVDHKGRITIAGARSDDGNSGFPITLETKDLKGKIDVKDSMGRLIFSWTSAIDHNTQSIDTTRPKFARATSHSGLKISTPATSNTSKDTVDSSPEPDQGTGLSTAEPPSIERPFTRKTHPS